MPDGPPEEVSPLVAPFKMFVDGGSVIFSSANSMFQNLLNMGAQNVQDISQTIQRGHAQVVQSVNQATHGVEAAAKKPLTDMQQMARGSGLAPEAQAEPQKTMFSPIGFSQQPTRPAQSEEYHPITEYQSNYREGGFTEHPEAQDQRAQSKTRKTAIF